MSLRSGLLGKMEFWNVWLQSLKLPAALIRGSRVLYSRLIASLLVVCVLNLLLGGPVASQTRALPRAGFQSMTGGGGQLPSSAGVHLTPGLNRGANAGPQLYNPGEPTLKMGTVRWERKKMPIMIWISPGYKLPDCAFEEIQNTRVDLVFDMLQQETPFMGMETAPGWSEDVNFVVASGIEQWREFESEGLISFGFTDDPRKAHVLVFFTDAFREANSPGGISVGGITSAQIYPQAQALQINIAQKPVIIELATMTNSNPDKLRGASAHEFGHALGIKAHSPYREDLMYVDRVVDELSPSDKATFRWLYRRPKADYVM
jgi:hypothetical protein